MSKKCPHIVQIDTDTHKILKLLSAGLNMTMGQIVKVMALECLIVEKETQDRRISRSCSHQPMWCDHFKKRPGGPDAA